VRIQALDISLLAYPTLTEAAHMLCVSASTLSRREDLVCERMGERDKRIPAGEVLRLAVVYRKRALSEVAAALIGCAREGSPQHTEQVQEQVQEEVERFFEQSASSALSESGFLAEAKRALPAELYEQVREVYGMSEIGTVVQSEDGRFDRSVRVREKHASRAADEHDLRSGRKTAEQLRLENELFAAFAGSARVDLSASRSLG
jgi:hypothetical protein